jgi:hypothetical protein
LRCWFVKKQAWARFWNASNDRLHNTDRIGFLAGGTASLGDRRS